MRFHSLSDMFDKMVYGMIKSRMAETVPFAKYLGLELTEVGAGTATATLPDAADLANHLGAQHVGALFAVAQTAAGAAIAGMFGQKILGLRPILRDANVCFGKNARGKITADAKVVGDVEKLAKTVDESGHVDFPVAVSLVDAAGVEVSSMTFAWNVAKSQPT